MVELTSLFALALIAFAGGALGASLGGYPALSVAGFVVVVGEVAKLTRASIAAAAPIDPAALGATGITASIGLGTGVGPHVALGGGVAAAAYAARQGYVDTDFAYHEAKHVTYSLGAKPDVLLVGGVFGVVGAALAQGSVAFALPWDPIFASIVVSAFLHRIAFGYPLLGAIRGGLLDMSPFERGERRAMRTDGGTTEAESRATTEPSQTDARFVVEPWLPHQYRWASVTLLGFVVGVFAAFVTYATGSPFLAFGLTAATLVFLSLRMEKFPVTHHMALPAGVLVIALVGAADPALLQNGVTPEEVEIAVTLHLAVVAGGVMGAVSGLFGELAQRVLYAHADTHLDPPAVAIVLSTLLIALLDIAGLVTQNIVPTLGL
ncbi:hypothetical protein [Halorarius litoreus]|uniref:hypothetical protein n=1 Tax=Halorarius litoreus TaxID=2962676 RepID=UPI0020CE04C5|nr:hypothetical protein [Halorarius litoreus]